MALFHYVTFLNYFIIKINISRQKYFNLFCAFLLCQCPLCNCSLSISCEIRNSHFQTESIINILPYCCLLSCATFTPSRVEHRGKAASKGVLQCLCLYISKWERTVWSQSQETALSSMSRSPFLQSG